MDIPILDVVDSEPVDYQSREELWFLFDRSDSSSLRRCFFPNHRVVDRAIRAMIKDNPEVRNSPSDFYFVHAATVFHVLNDGVSSELYCRSGLNSPKEFKDYAN